MILELLSNMDIVIDAVILLSKCILRSINAFRILKEGLRIQMEKNIIPKMYESTENIAVRIMLKMQM